MTDVNQVTAAELLQFIERAELLAAEKRDVTEQEKELFAELSGRGYDKKVVRKIIRDRAIARDDLAEFEAVEQLYRDALGMA